jgi:protein-tyrosine phosphatase
MLTDGAASLAAIAELVATGTPLLFHCAAGKDRTGVVAAFLLSLVGVARAEIVEDYHATAGAMAAFLEWLRVEHPEAVDSMTAQPPEYLEAPPGAMAAFLDVVDERWGSMAGYAASIGVEADVVSRLRTVLVG